MSIRKRHLKSDDTDKPNAKRRKLSDCLKVIFEERTAMKKQIKQLSEENKIYKHGVNLYKQEANKWHSNYMQLQLRQFILD